MNINEALAKIGGPTRGMTSVISALMGGGDVKSVAGGPHGTESLAEAKSVLERYRKAQSEAQSDASWWGYQGDVSYWQTVVKLLEAAQLVGADNLPDVTYDDRGGVVMDICSRQERFGEQVLAEARKRTQS